MPTRFESLFYRTAANHLVRQFGETVTYYAGGTGSGREIQAIVERGTPRVIAETGDIASQHIIVRVKNSSKDGITSTEVNTGSDTIGVPVRVGEVAKVRSIVRVMSDNAGIVEVLCQ